MRIGVDLVSVSRMIRAVARHGDRFLDRIFTAHEKSLCSGDACCLAGRFAAKEAVSKALGTGLWHSGIVFQDIEILRGRNGEPVVTLHGSAIKHFDALGGITCHVSISHEKEMACAFCVIETVHLKDESVEKTILSSSFDMHVSESIEKNESMSVES